MEIKVKPEDFETLCYFNSIKDKALIEILKEGKTTVDVGRWLKSVRASKFVAEDVLHTLDRSRSELQTAVDEPNSYEREGYSYLTKQKLTRYHKFICDSYEDVQSFIDKFYPKKSRKKKPVDPSRLVKNLKYLQKDDALGLQSVDPKDILGSSVLLTYNTKSRVLTLYVSSESNGFGIKGCSILNWDEAKSQSKKLRKPKETISIFTDAGYATIQSRFSGIKTKPSKPNGRINSSTIILVYKKFPK